MKTVRNGALVLLGACGALVACGGGGGTTSTFQPGAGATSTAVIFVGSTPAPTAPPSITLSASPASFTFGGLDPMPPPQSGSVAASPMPVSLALSIDVADPTVIGVSIGESFAAWPARFVVYPVAHGSTTATFSAGGASTTIAAATGLCGRPDALSPASQLVYPRPGATDVSPSTGKLYFAVWLRATSFVPPTFPTIGSHLIVGAHETQEGSTLQPDTPPPGSASVDTTRQGTLQYMSATVPPLRAATAYRTQIYDDACQPALLTGSFTTS
jgi:hypothetical protein